MAKRNETKMFLKKAIAAYKICSGYLLKKIPINKRTLRHLSAIDPQVQGHKVTPQYQKRLPKIVTQVLSTDDQKQQYEEEVQSFNAVSMLT